MACSPGVEKALADLDFPRLAQVVVAGCVGPRGLDPTLPLATSHEGTERALAETAEALATLVAGEPLPLDGLRPIRPHLLRLSRMGALDGPGLRDTAIVLGAARRLRRFLSGRREHFNNLWEACGTDPTLDEVADHIDRAIDGDGTVDSRASAELGRLRTEVANLRARLVQRLETLIHQHGDILQDRYYTLREGRYVLPVRVDAHERLPGIVHATSGSGATVFVEPRALVGQGNRLKMALAEMEREEVRILAALSARVRERLAEIGAAVDALDHADLRNACARFGQRLGARVLPLADGPRISLKAARHPLLLAEGVEVVANDLEMEGGKALVLSGPNAGGKTVALKQMGLAALMVRAGLPVPADEGSSIGYFDLVLTDIGDDQSVAKNLSTFSAHVTNLRTILASAGPRSLVLLDEVATGTDPEEGAALACAVVDSLCRAGAALAVTTHYEALKALGLRDERLRNASVGFDVEQMAPTFAIAYDVPGSSSALAIAARFGIPAKVIDTAKRMLPEQARTFDELVQRLHESRRVLELQRASVAEDVERVARLREEVEDELLQLRQRDEKALSHEATRLMEGVRKARDELSVARKEARQRGRDESALQRVRRAADEAQEAIRQAQDHVAAGASSSEGESRDRPMLDAIEIGGRVWVPRLRSEVIVLEGPTRGRVRVAVGALKVWVDADELRGTGDGPTKVAARSKQVAARSKRRALPAAGTDNTLDVRGMRVDDALAMVEAFVDRLYGADEPVAYVLHGHGTGALRDAVRRHMAAATHYVRQARAATLDEGGDAFTVVELK